MKRRSVCGVGALAWALAAAAAPAYPPPAGVVFVAPARPSVVQVLQDVVGRYPGNLLISYQAGETAEETILHRWDGRGWAFVSNEAYRSGRLMRSAPRRIVLFGPDEILPDRLVLDSEAWAPVVLAVPEMDRATLITTAGRLLDFSPADWRFYARRYGLRLADGNEPLREDVWFEQPHEPRRFQLPEPPVPPRRQDRRHRTHRDQPPARPPPDSRMDRPDRTLYEAVDAPAPEVPARRRPVRAPPPAPPQAEIEPEEMVLPEVSAAEPPPEQDVPPEAAPLLPSPLRAAPAQPEEAEASPDISSPTLPGIK